MSLIGKTAFITGSSRGIGKAIALKLAQNGANVIIAAKSVTPHPLLPGTIYSVVKEITNAGGNALACELDIRNEAMIEQAVKSTVDTFGGIDILINNASAITLSSLERLETKKLDLMLHINIRGTLLCTKYCIEHLLKSSNPHVINLSPPLPLNLNWYKTHSAYTVTKAAMSGIVTGLAEDYRTQGIAFNALWPKTTIKTAAIDLLSGGDDSAFDYCRKPEIMADAAYEIVTKKSRDFTNNFCIDEEVLKDSGITDFSVYNYVENPNLMNDIFLGEPPGFYKFEKNSSSSENKSSADLFIKLNLILPQLKEKSDLKFSLNLTDLNEVWVVDFGLGKPEFKLSDEACNFCFSASSQVFGDILCGGLNPMVAYSAGSLSYSGDVGVAMKIIQLINNIKKLF